MAKLERVTYTPASGTEGSRLHASLQVGEQQLTSSWPVSDHDGTLQPLLDQLSVMVREVTYIAAPGGTEIQVMLEIGSHRYVAAFPLDETSADLERPIDNLMDAVGKTWVDSLQTLLSERSTT